MERRKMLTTATALTVAAATVNSLNSKAYALPNLPYLFDQDPKAQALATKLLNYKPTSAQIAQHVTNMQVAINISKQNPKYPFGAAIFQASTNKLLAKGFNPGKGGNLTLHGEMVAISNFYSQKLNVKTDDLILYTTGEPCSMCSSAIAWCGITKVVWASSIDTIQKSGIAQIMESSIEVAARSHDIFTPEYFLGGIGANQTDLLFINRPR